MKIQKYILSLLIGSAAISFSSCNDFLDRDPLGQFTEDDAPNALLGGKIYNVYYLMRSYNITAGIPSFMIEMARSEDSEKGSSAGDGADVAAMYDDFEYTASNGTMGAYWTQNYKIIFQCNEVLDDIEKEGKTDTETMRNKGEALFFRAYCYFNLVRAWGEVPLITYMMRNDWDNMYKLSTEVIGKGLYNLDTPVDKIFTVDGENCGSSIFELQYESTDALKNSLTIGSQFCEVQGVRGSGDWNLGWGWHMATTELGKAFEPGDPRKDATLLYFRRSIDEPITEANTNKPYGESPVSTAMGAYFNKKAYTEPSLRKKYTKGGFWVNIRLIRYTDVLLMAAEAANEKNLPGEAKTYLEMVRSHARGLDKEILPEVTTNDKVELRKAIMHERRVELALEPGRFYDLVRWGTAKEVLAAAGKTYQDKNAYLPIPQTEIDKSKGVLVQNPNY